MTELSGGFPKSDTLSTQHKQTISSVQHRAQYHSVTLERFNLCVCVYLSSGQLKQESHRMSVVFMGGGS